MEGSGKEEKVLTPDEKLASCLEHFVTPGHSCYVWRGEM